MTFGRTNQGPPSLYYDGVLEMDRNSVLQECMRHVIAPGLWAEFGVGGGRSAQVILEKMPLDEELYLFDSWEGLPEAWKIHDGLTIGKGELKHPQPDFRDPRCRYFKGWFEDTVGPAVAAYEDEHLRGASFLHIDGDLQSSCACVLQELQHIIFEGTVIVFDELHGFQCWLRGEWPAWRRCAKANNFSYRWIAREEPGRDALSAGLIIT